MPAKANISPGYRWRLGLISLALLAFAAWFFYDGLIRYPATQAREQEMAQRYEQIHEEHPADSSERWADYAAEQGWSEKIPGEPMSDTDILAQFLYGGACVIIGLPFLIAFIRSGGRWIASDEQGLKTSWGQQADWDQLRSVNTDRWKTKGIAVVRYRDAAGGDAERKLTLDDWKFEREPTVTMFEEVRRQLDPEGAQAAEAASANDTSGEPEEPGVGVQDADPADETTPSTSA